MAVAVAVWGVPLAAYGFGPREIPYYWILFFAPLAGFLALGWDEPSWRESV